MARKVHVIDLDSDGDVVTFRYRKPAPVDMEKIVAQTKVATSNVDALRALFSEYLVGDDGKKVSDDFLKELLEDTPFEVSAELQRAIIPKSAEEAKKA